MTFSIWQSTRTPEQEKGRGGGQMFAEGQQQNFYPVKVAEISSQISSIMTKATLKIIVWKRSKKEAQTLLSVSYIIHYS